MSYICIIEFVLFSNKEGVDCGVTPTSQTVCRTEVLISPDRFETLEVVL